MTTATDALWTALEAVQQAAADLQRDVNRLAEIKATIRVNALRGGATTDEVEAMVRGEKSFVDFLAKLCDDRAALAAAPQPAPEDREALVEVIGEVLRPPDGIKDYRKTEYVRDKIADALLARGLRLPGPETMAWALVGDDEAVLADTVRWERGDVDAMFSDLGPSVRVAIRVVEGGDDE